MWIFLLSHFSIIKYIHKVCYRFGLFFLNFESFSVQIESLQLIFSYPGPNSFLRSSKEWDLIKICYEDLHEVSFFERSLLNFFGKSCEDFWKKRFYEDFGLKLFLLKILLRPVEDLQFKIFWDLWKILCILF